MNKKIFSKLNIALFIALLFHVSGAIGILFSPNRQWFVNNTPLTLLIMATLLVLTQPEKNIWFYAFAAFLFVAGVAVELIGVHTSLLFGHYSYGAVLGPKFKGVPWLIGPNWFIIIYCSGTIIHQLDEWVQTKLSADMQFPPAIKWVAFLSDAALLATFFDWVLEPVATKLGFWHWQNNVIPAYNYACWFAASLLLAAVFRMLPFKKHNQFAVHLFIIQLLFFFLLQTFL